jgi:integrase
MADGGGTLDPKADPRRRCLKLQNWPDVDREAWQAAVAEGSLLHGRGAAAHWRETTRKAVQDAYGRWLTFLDRSGWLDPDVPPAERVSPERLRGFIDDLQATVASITVRTRITNLSEALRVMAPDAELAYLRRARARLKARAKPIRSKKPQIVPIGELLRLGLDLTERAERGDTAREIWRAALYRDGVMIMMLACRPIRRRSFALLRLGCHLVKRETCYAIILDESETKNHRRYEQPLHPALTGFIDRYLDAYRPLLLAGADDDRLWISWRGKPMSDAVVYGAIVSRTRAAFGVGIPPHRFRDSAVTSMGEKDPELVWLAPSLLHHADRRIAELHYDQARDARAVGLWQEHVRATRRATNEIGRIPRGPGRG